MERCLATVQGMFRDVAAALLVPPLLTLGYLLLVIIQPDEWYSPQYAVPLVGMLLGNALNGVTIGVKTFLEMVSAERHSIEWALAMGASRYEAMWCGALSFSPAMLSSVPEQRSTCVQIFMS
jgi:putative ABC transport system permease protein